MLFFRKFRERRANRRKQRQQKGAVYKGVNTTDAIGFGKEAAVFRTERVSIGMSPYNAMTTDPTQDDDDASMTSSVYMRLLNPSATNELQDEDAVFDDKALSRANEELQDLKAQLEQVQDLHNECMLEKNDELLVCQVGWGFAKERSDELDKELKQIKANLETTEDKLNETITELDDVKVELEAKSALLTQAEKTIEEKDQVIFDLGKALDQGKRGAKVVLGLLTLGALCTDNER